MEKGFDVRFICRELPGNLNNFIENKGFKVYRLPYNKEQGSNVTNVNNHSHWLGTTWQNDVFETVNILSNEKLVVNWFIIDHYSLDQNWEKELRPYVKKIMVIDDLADRPHDCDLLLDQNLCKNANKYRQLVSENCITLIGPRYALLRPEFITARQNLRNRDDNIKRVLVFLGGSDPTNETKKVLDAIIQLNQSNIQFDIVVGQSNPHKYQIRDLCMLEPNITLHTHVNNMAELMVNADLAIGAGGSTTWERSCLGLPSIVLSIAQNQEQLTTSVADYGALTYLGRAEEVNTEIIVRAVKEHIQGSKSLTEMSEKGKQLVDGFGVERVVNAINISPFKITILSDAKSWINLYIPLLVIKYQEKGHSIKWVHMPEDISEGDFAFYLGCSQLVPMSILSKNRHNLVVHESDLPNGKGWSPLTWQILEGKNEIPITLFEAGEKVDSGVVYLKDVMKFQGLELVDDLRKIQAETTIKMCLEFVDRYPDIIQYGVKQQGESTYYPRRTPKDSRLDVNKTIQEQFNLLRVVDNENYPAFFDINGYRYILKIERRLEIEEKPK
ncbi:hypothetical protein N752_05290 [Desulforamulus aquiferis]|nr:UDP-2,4-diacetamido-2,4,6-trideoxy-beta-L-altropyranose hydrolase [Desulforamulus aquiferis]RYD06308.1 hypothetical protein N752_05290 [Desulforamulus aquiferis]